jgi:hypothetical protein
MIVQKCKFLSCYSTVLEPVLNFYSLKLHFSMFLAKRSQLRLASILHRGLFNEDLFIVKKAQVAGPNNSFSKLVFPSDQIADSIHFKNTEFRTDMLVVLKVYSQEKICVGWLKGQLPEIFDPQYLSSIKPTLAPD